MNASPVLTIEQARERHVMGWNIACQVCGSFGASWAAPHPLESAQRGNHLRLCPTHRAEWDGLHRRFSDERRALTRVRFTEDGRERHPCL